MLTFSVDQLISESFPLYCWRSKNCCENIFMRKNVVACVSKDPSPNMGILISRSWNAVANGQYWQKKIFRSQFITSLRLFAANSLWSVPSECLQMVRPDKGSTVTVSTELDECTVCTVSGGNDTQTCQSFLSLVPEEEVQLLFKCNQPIEQAYSVMINRTIGEFTDDLMMHTVN